MSTALEVLDRTTGELLDLRECDEQRLGEFLQHVKTLRGELAEAERAVSDEVLRRCDRAASWTMRLDGITLTAPSPTAGSEEYPADMLRDALDELIVAGLIAPSAAEHALRRQLLLTADVPWGVDLGALVTRLQDTGVELAIAGQPVNIATVGSSEQPVKAGVNALRKNPATHHALDGARVRRDPPPRKVKVTGQ